jgi:hypothetical protein
MTKAFIIAGHIIIAKTLAEAYAYYRRMILGEDDVK